MDNLELAATAMVKEIQKWRDSGSPDFAQIKRIQERMARLLRLNIEGADERP